MDDKKRRKPKPPKPDESIEAKMFASKPKKNSKKSKQK